MYLYQITNLINGKIYIGQTNNVMKRWSNHRCGNNPSSLIAMAIKKYGKENFLFEILLRNVSIDDIDELEIATIKEKDCLTPKGYNISEGGGGSRGVSKYGADNSNAHLTQEEAQYILDHRDLPMYILYDKVSNKMTYNQFKKLYHHQTYLNLLTTTKEYPHNQEFSNLFCELGLEYDEVVSIRKRYQNGDFWKDVYLDYKDVYINEWSFWNAYNGRSYKLIMPEVFTEENKKKHASMARQGERNGRAKLKEQDVLKIRKKHSEGAANQELYKMYPQVSPATIRDIINGKTWTNLL